MNTTYECVNNEHLKPNPLKLITNIAKITNSDSE